MWLAISPTTAKKTFFVLHACPSGERVGRSKIDVSLDLCTFGFKMVKINE